MSSVAWVHDDALRHWYGHLPTVYIFDDAKLKREQWRLKRIGFLYECLLELPVEIRRGGVVAQVQDFQKQQGADSMVTQSTPDPHLRQQAAHLRAPMLAPPDFVHKEGKLDLRRFSKYWAKAKRALRNADNQKQRCRKNQ
jgi:hypothetical protein